MRFIVFPTIITLFLLSVFLFFYGLWKVLPRAEYSGLAEYGVKSAPTDEEVSVSEKKEAETEKEEPEPEITKAEIGGVALSVGEGKSVLIEVPFISQAPSANWENIIFQQGCEEASVLMAMMWAKGKRWATVGGIEQAIVSLSNFEQKTYGEFRDASIKDTAQLVRDYFNYTNIRVESGIDARAIKAELVEGNLVIVAVNGRKLNNPFYTPPGPEQHMLVIKGYDKESGEFISNDPGTRHGEGLRYGEEILENALRDYRTGYKEPISEVNKRMIVVGKEA